MDQETIKKRSKAYMEWLALTPEKRKARLDAIKAAEDRRRGAQKRSQIKYLEKKAQDYISVAKMYKIACDKAMNGGYYKTEIDEEGLPYQIFVSTRPPVNYGGEHEFPDAPPYNYTHKPPNNFTSPLRYSGAAGLCVEPR